MRRYKKYIQPLYYGDNLRIVHGGNILKSEQREIPKTLEVINQIKSNVSTEILNNTWEIIYYDNYYRMRNVSNEFNTTKYVLGTMLYNYYNVEQVDIVGKTSSIFQIDNLKDRKRLEELKNTRLDILSEAVSNRLQSLTSIDIDVLDLFINDMKSKACWQNGDDTNCSTSFTFNGISIPLNGVECIGETIENIQSVEPDILWEETGHLDAAKYEFGNMNEFNCSRGYPYYLDSPDTVFLKKFFGIANEKTTFKRHTSEGAAFEHFSHNFGVKNPNLRNFFSEKASRLLRKKSKCTLCDDGDVVVPCGSGYYGKNGDCLKCKSKWATRYALHDIKI